MTMPVTFSVQFNPTTFGSGDFVVASAVAGFQTPEQAGAIDGKVYSYLAKSSDGTVWEFGSGTYTYSTHTLSRATISSSSAGSVTAPISFAVAPVVAVFPSPTPTLEPPPATIIRYDVAQSLTSSQKNQAQDNAGLPAIMRSYLAGLKLSTAGSSATFSVAAGVAADSANVDIMTLAASLSKTTSAWAVGSGNGALDTGSIAATTWYHVYLIKRTDTQVVDILISLSATAPTLPTSYTLFRRIGAIGTNGSSQWLSFIQNGDEFLWAAPNTDVNTNSLGTTATLFALSVPFGAQVNALFRGYVFNASATVLYLINSPDETSAAVNTPAGNVTAQNPIAAGSSGSTFTLNVRTNTSSQIRAVSGGASTTLVIATYGWIDRRGRDA